MKRNIAPTILIILFVALFVFAGPAQATDLSGNISMTVMITEDSQLVGDVTCTVPLSLAGANPCIVFGADHIKLRLNGHTITGQWRILRPAAAFRAILASRLESRPMAERT